MVIVFDAACRVLGPVQTFGTLLRMCSDLISKLNPFKVGFVDENLFSVDLVRLVEVIITVLNVYLFIHGGFKRHVLYFYVNVVEYLVTLTSAGLGPASHEVVPRENLWYPG